ncbi:IS21 family transposase, partial [Myroides sp. NP-2]|nr:IS21 family transposase [Myroides sp. NP-2]
DSLQDFALYHNTTILPTRAYHPKDKALVENAVKITYRRVFAPLRNKQFFDLKSLNEAIRELVDLHNNQPLKKEKISRRALFEEIERAELMPLPEIQYQPKDFSRGTVQKNSHVYLSKDKHYYSVPFAYIGKKVLLMYSKNVVEVYHEQRRIAFHNRVYSKYGYTTQKEHLPSSYQYMSDWNPNRFISWARNIGEYTEHYIAKVLEKKHHPEQSYKSCIGILSLAKKVGEIRLENACKRASDYGRYNYKSILDILDKGLDQFHDEELYQEKKLPKHRNIRGGKYYE